MNHGVTSAGHDFIGTFLLDFLEIVKLKKNLKNLKKFLKIKKIIFKIIVVKNL